MTVRPYDLRPTITVPGDERATRGWEEVAARLRRAVAAAVAARAGAGRTTVVVETYPGVLDDELLPALTQAFAPAHTFLAADVLRTPDEVDRLLAPYMNGGDPVFGRLCELDIADFFDPARLEQARARLGAARGLVLVYGTGAARLAPDADLVVLADLARWEIQRRQRAGLIGNLGADNRSGGPALKYKQAYFVDWRAADRLKRTLLDHAHFLLDTNRPGDPRLISGDALRTGLAHCITRPFRVVPFFDPGPWGGQWMRTRFGLDPAPPNFAWGFDCVPEENSLLLDVGGVDVEIPAVDLVFRHPRELLGEAVFGRFGAEFPIRFDLLDTMGGGNLSLQVHPLTEYARHHFAIAYTQDESYYLLDAEPDGCCYLGLTDSADVSEFGRQLHTAQQGGPPPDVERFVNRFPARKHDHFLIPAGTVHCSGRGSVVLEVSATPYIFTFKLWDWQRLGMDGRPRPVHLGHGLANLQTHRRRDYVLRELVNRIEPVAEGPGWREERTGLHEAEFIETRRHWFTGPVAHHTSGGVNVLNLVEGPGAVVESPTGAFAPFTVAYAETFILPAAVGEYVIKPISPSTPCATLKAFVRTRP